MYLRKVLAPLVLSLFAMGWYRFSEVYIVGSDQIALSHGNYAVYVIPAQLDGYLVANLWICYSLVFVGLSMFWYNLVKYVKDKGFLTEGKGSIDLAFPLAIAAEIIALFTIGSSIIGGDMTIRLAGYTCLIACLMWFWYSLVNII
ncbi:hypothetical protein, partial [Acidianus sp. RZ1]|uniref:hypothetical protein n=1 Tax=Acidianus sp. RZ1 TaxID=1540082 RepID=UPI0035304380